MTVKGFEESFLDLYYEKNITLFQAYTGGLDLDTSKVDDEIYRLLSQDTSTSYPFIGRLYVDTSPMVSALVNRIDNLSNYECLLAEVDLKDRKSYKIAMARAMRDDVVDLMALRDSQARELNFRSYPDLVLASDGMSPDSLRGFLRVYLDHNLSHAQDLVKKYQMTWPNWFGDLDKICSSQKVYSSQELMAELLESFDFSLSSQINIQVLPEAFSFAMATSKKDIHIVLQASASLRQVATLFHELGHAIYYDLIEGDGINNVLPASLNETMAVVMEYLASQILLEGQDKVLVNDLMHLEYTRCAISGLYELDLWQDPDQAESLYQDHYSKLAIDLDDPSVWSYDSFRSLDTVYIHNYVLGYDLGRKIYAHLKKVYNNDYKKWGRWLEETIYKHGSSLRIQDIMDLCR